MEPRQVPNYCLSFNEDNRSFSGTHRGICSHALSLLGEVRQSGGKLVVAFAGVMILDPATIRSNRIESEWPPRSGRRIEISEIDEARWFTLEGARLAMLASSNRSSIGLRQ